MKTRYRDFLEYYEEIHKDSDNNEILKFKRYMDRFKNIDDVLWSDAELAFGKYSEEFDAYKESDIKRYLDCRKNFSNELADYLETEEKRLILNDKNCREMLAYALKDLTKDFRTEPKNELNAYMKAISGNGVFKFISFNYTNTVDRCNELLQKPGVLGERLASGSYYKNIAAEKVLHVHGYLDKDLVFAVNDVSQIVNTELYNNADALLAGFLIKQEANRLYQEGTDKKVHEVIENSHLIYIYGMAIGDTDALWWKRICLELKRRSNLRVIVYSYSAPKEGRDRSEYLLHERTIRERIVSFGDFSDAQKEEFMKRIYVTGTDIFHRLASVVKINYDSDKNDEKESEQTVVTVDMLEKRIDNYMGNHIATNDEIDNMFT